MVHSQCGPSWARTSDPLIMSFLYSIYYTLRKSRVICVIFNINRVLCIYTNIINCSFYVKYSTALHGFAEILAKKLAPFSISYCSLNIEIIIKDCYICELNILFFSMSSSLNIKNNIILSIFKDVKTVFRLRDIALILGEKDFESLNKKLNYYVRTNKLLNPRKGIYAKPNYNSEELACLLYTPTYISLEYVLQKEGVLFQFDSRITSVSYLSRSIDVQDKTFIYRKIKGEIIANTKGISRQINQVNIATGERAFLDLLYLNKNYYFDNLNPLNKAKIYDLLPIYMSKALTDRVKKLFSND